MNVETHVTLGEPLSPADLEAIRRPQLEPLRPAQQALVVVYLIAAVAYLGWRSTTLNPAAPIFSGLVYGAELFGFGATLLHLFMVWKLTIRPRSLPAAGLWSTSWCQPTTSPSRLKGTLGSLSDFGQVRPQPIAIHLWEKQQ